MDRVLSLIIFCFKIQRTTNQKSGSFRWPSDLIISRAPSPQPTNLRFPLRLLSPHAAIHTHVASNISVLGDSAASVARLRHADPLPIIVAGNTARAAHEFVASDRNLRTVDPLPAPSTQAQRLNEFACSY